jgi:biopolymer transport protein ExbD
MNWLKTNNSARVKNTIWTVAFVVVLIMTPGAVRSTGQALQKGISVELAPTSSAVPVPDADHQDSLIVTVTDRGRLYFGIEPVKPEALAATLEARPSHRTEILYIKADARAPYASVVKVLDAAHTAGVAGVTLLTSQPKMAAAGTAVPPEGIEMEMARP